jgi:short-subunit dehydrogenase
MAASGPALVTGASSGIGWAFAEALAARGHDLVVVARRGSRLEELADALRDRHGRSIDTLVADLSADDGVSKVAARLTAEAEPIDLLVNNAGFGTAGRFWDLDPDREAEEIRVNVEALVVLTHAALRAMVPRGTGGVINVSSIAGYQPTPGDATYGATKAFVSSFTNALHEELRGTGVRMLTLAPGFTHTEFHDISGDDVSELPSVLWQTPGEVVDAALRAYDRGRAVCIPGPVNTAAAVFSGSLPAGVTRRVAALTRRRST